jgi:hypothetical protein
MQGYSIVLVVTLSLNIIILSSAIAFIHIVSILSGQHALNRILRILIRFLCYLC